MPKAKPKKPKKRRSVKLTEAQLEIVGPFNDYAFESNLTFERAARKALGLNLFPPTPQGRLFEKECREVFERERL